MSLAYTRDLILDRLTPVKLAYRQGQDSVLSISLAVLDSNTVQYIQMRQALILLFRGEPVAVTISCVAREHRALSLSVT